MINLMNCVFSLLLWSGTSLLHDVKCVRNVLPGPTGTGWQGRGGGTPEAMGWSLDPQLRPTNGLVHSNGMDKGPPGVYRNTRRRGRGGDCRGPLPNRGCEYPPSPGPSRRQKMKEKIAAGRQRRRGTTEARGELLPQVLARNGVRA